MRLWSIPPTSEHQSKKSMTNFQNDLIIFPKKFSLSSKKLSLSAKISDDLLLVIDYKFFISPPFSRFQDISPYFRKILFPPPLLQIFLWFRKIYVFLHTLCVFRFPLVWPWGIYMYASHNARTDASDATHNDSTQCACVLNFWFKWFETIMHNRRKVVFLLSSPILA